MSVMSIKPEDDLSEVGNTDFRCARARGDTIILHVYNRHSIL